MAIPDLRLAEAPAIDLPTGDDVVVPTTGRSRLVPLAQTVAGIALILVAGWGIRSADKIIRTLVFFVGAGLLWRGLQRLGTLRFGASFRLGLWVSIVWLAVLTFAAIFADWLPIAHWSDSDITTRGASDLPPALRWPEPLGRDTDTYSLLSHVIYGARTSLVIGFIAVLLGLTIGLVVGLIGGWYGKSVDATLSVGTNTILAFPPLILLLSIVAVRGSSVRSIAIGLAVLSIPTYARLMRAQTLTLRQREFVLAARAMGASNRRLMWREVFPNAILPVVSYTFIVFAVVIVAEASLAYLGYGIPPPDPSWGSMIKKGELKLKTDPHLVFVPAAVIFLTVLSLNRVGEWTRSAVLGVKSDGR